MTPEKARQIIVEGVNYAAYRETDSSLYDSDANRLSGSQHYNSGHHVAKPSPWSEGNFEEKMAMLLRWAVLLQSQRIFPCGTGDEVADLFFSEGEWNLLASYLLIDAVAPVL